MLQHHLLALLLGLALLLLRHFVPPAAAPPTPQRFFAIGERVPLTAVIAAASRRNPNPHYALLPLTPSSARRRPRSPPTAAPPNPPTLHWPRPDNPLERRLSVPRALLTAPAIRHLLVFPALPAVLCPVPGAAAASLTAHLSAAAAELHPLSALALRDRERMLARSEVARALFVVHPFVRALAAYYRGTRAAGGLDGQVYREFISRVRGYPLEDYEHELQIVSLHFFLSFLARQSPADLHPDFRSQTVLCFVGRVHYNFVGRVENLAADLQALDARLGIRGAVVHDDQYTHEAADDSPEVFQSLRFRSKAAKLYAEDLRNFGYSPTEFPR